jgi:zinc/manganese transport system ATP-binding protein
MTAPAIELHGAAVSLGGREVFGEVDLEVAAGEFVAVLGSNGAGKTTLLRALLGLVALSAGRASVLGRSPAAARPRIGYVPQRRAFDATSRIRGVDLVGLGLDGARWGIPLPLPDRLDRSGRRQRRRARVQDVIGLVGAGAYATRAIGELSGGEQQRLLIAQALVREPEILMLDEPLDGLDLANQAAVTALVSSVCRSRDVAVLLVAHDVNPLLAYLDRVLYLAAGRALSGAPAEVITSPTLSRLYGAPVEVLRASDGRLVVVGQTEPPAIHTPRHAH